MGKIAEHSARLESILTEAGINTRRVTVIGAYAHIDTFKKYASPIRSLMGAAGFALVMERDGVHMDGFDGFRVVYKLAEPSDRLKGKRARQIIADDPAAR